MARLWIEYAKADARWGGADLSIISIELLTVGLAGPIALFICYAVAKTVKAETPVVKARYQTWLWFMSIVLATGELCKPRFFL
jgi:hypothetical protein